MVLDKGFVVVRRKNKKITEEYRMRLVSKQELNQVIELQDYVYENLPNKQVLVTDTREEILEDMDWGAQVIGVYNSKGQLICYRYFSFPAYRKKNMGKYIGIDDSEFGAVVHLETTIVHPDYRGNDLQNRTLKQALKISASMGCHHLICTVSPFNFYSLYNIMKNGLKIKALRKMYQEGYLRFILHRNLHQDLYFEQNDIIRSKFDDISSSTNLINEGYIGFVLDRESQDIDFAKPEGYRRRVYA